MTKEPITRLRFDNGDQMPAIGLGTWKSAPEALEAAVKEAVRIGYRHIDCAFIYDNEKVVGRAVNDLLRAGAVKRDALWITSKLWNDAHAPEDVGPALERTLERLGLDYLDLFLVHWPVAVKQGVTVPQSTNELLSLEEIPLPETWSAMESLVSTGKCRHIGVSNFSAQKISLLLDQCRRPPEVNQVERHPYLQQNRLVSFCRENNVHVTAYAPLGSIDRPISLKSPHEPVLLKDPVVGAIAETKGVTPAQILISWALHQGTAVIPKSVDPGRLAENLAAGEVLLTEDDMHRLSTMDRHYRYLSGKFWEMPGGPYTVSGIWDE